MSKLGSKRILGGAVLVTATSLIATAAWAHHSFAAFDMTKTAEVSGEVKEWRWANPHSWLVVSFKDAAGATQEMNLEANGPGYLVRQGWKRETLKPGDTIKVKLNPMVDGSYGGNLVSVTFSDGRTLSAAPVRAPAPAAAAPAAPAAGEKK